MENPLARLSPLRDLALSLPPMVLALMTWGALAAEMFFLPLSIFRRGRLLAWLAATGLYLWIMCFISFADLSVGMLMFHLMVFDTTWIGSRQEYLETNCPI